MEKEEEKRQMLHRITDFRKEMNSKSPPASSLVG
jgi:hypothetical protein